MLYIGLTIQQPLQVYCLRLSNNYLHKNCYTHNTQSSNY